LSFYHFRNIIEQMKAFQQKYTTEDFLRIVCTGDAQTAQKTVLPNWINWVEYVLQKNGDIQQAWKKQVFSTASEKSSLKHAITYLTHYVGQIKPDLLIFSFGQSYLSASYNETEVLAELDQFALSVQKMATEVAVWSPYPLPGGEGRDMMLGLQTLYKQKAADYNWEYIDVFHEFDEFELSRLFVNSDGRKYILNQAGNFIVAKKVLQQLFSLSMPESSVGSFILPDLEQLKKWR